MAPKGASTQVNPIRLQSVARLKIKRPDKQEVNPCLGPMSAMLSSSRIACASFFFYYRLISRQVVGLPPATASKAALSSNKRCESVWMPLYVKRSHSIQDGHHQKAILTVMCDRNLHRNRRAPSTITCRDYIPKYPGRRNGKAAWDDLLDVLRTRTSCIYRTEIDTPLHLRCLLHQVYNRMG
jgi:hypothetical protein